MPTQTQHYWLLTNEYPPFVGGGIATYSHTLATLLAKRNIQVTVFVRDTSLDQEKQAIANSKNIRVVRFHYQKPESLEVSYSHLLAIEYFRAITTYIQNYLPPLPYCIEAQECMGIAYYLLKDKWLNPQSLFAKTPILIHLHTPLFVSKSVNKECVTDQFQAVNTTLEIFCIRAASALICPSTFLYKHLKSVIPENIPCAIIPVPIPWFLSKIKVRKQLNQSLRIIFTGRLEQRKGIIQFIEKTQAILIQNKIQLTIIGDGVLDEQLQQNTLHYIRSTYAELCSQGTLLVLGKVSTAELVQEIVKADVAIVPSHFENYPSTCIEHMYHGKAMLVSKQGGQADMVGTDGSCGYIFDWDISLDLEEKLHALVSLSRAKLKAMGVAAKERIETICSHDSIYLQRKMLLEKANANPHTTKNYPQICSLFDNRPFVLPKTTNIQQTTTTAVIIIDRQVTALSLKHTIASLQKTNSINQWVLIDGVDPYTQELSPLQKLAITLLPSEQTLCLNTFVNGFSFKHVLDNLKTEFFFCTLGRATILSTSILQWQQTLTHFTNIALCSSWFGTSGSLSQAFATIDISLPHAVFTSCIPAFLARTDYCQAVMPSLTQINIITELHCLSIELLRNNYSILSLPQQDITLQYTTSPALPLTNIHALFKKKPDLYTHEKVLLTKILTTL